LIKALYRYKRCFQASESDSRDKPDINDDFKCTSLESLSEDSMYEDYKGSLDVETRVVMIIIVCIIRGNIVDL
jgi:hypothetical protein